MTTNRAPQVGDVVQVIEHVFRPGPNGEQTYASEESYLDTVVYDSDRYTEGDVWCILHPAGSPEAEAFKEKLK